MKEKKLGGAIITVSGIIVIAKILGLIKQMITADAFGATIETDLISLSQGLVSNLDYVLTQTLITAFVPTYIYAKKESEKKANRFYTNSSLVFFIITITLSLLIIAFAGFLAKIIAPTYSGQLSNELARYIRIVAPSMVIFIQMAIVNALLKANDKFSSGELTSLFQSVIFIVFILLFGEVYGPNILITSMYAYSLVSLVFLLIVARPIVRIIIEKNPFSDPNIRQLFKMMGPMLIGYSMVFINQQVDAIIVSGLGEGIVTAMNYAAVLSNFISTITGGICGILFTYITKHISNNEKEKASGMVSFSMNQMITILIPISILFIANSNDIVDIVFGHGSFNDHAVSNCSIALVGYSFMFVFFAIRELYSRVQYAYKDSKTPMINSSISVVVNIILSLLLSKIWGVMGVTLATSISVSVCAILNLISVKKREMDIRLAKMKRSIVFWSVGGMLCVVISVAGQKFLCDWNAVLRFALISITCFLLYFMVNIKTLKALINIRTIK